MEKSILNTMPLHFHHPSKHKGSVHYHTCSLWGFYIHIQKPVTWVAQLVKYPTLGLSSGHDLTLVREALCSVWSQLQILPLPILPHPNK